MHILSMSIQLRRIRTLAPGVSPGMVVLGELAVTVTAGPPPFTGVAVKVYCIIHTAHTWMWTKPSVSAEV